MDGPLLARSSVGLDVFRFCFFVCFSSQCTVVIFRWYVGLVDRPSWSLVRKDNVPCRHDSTKIVKFFNVYNLTAWFLFLIFFPRSSVFSPADCRPPASGGPHHRQGRIVREGGAHRDQRAGRSIRANTLLARFLFVAGFVSLMARISFDFVTVETVVTFRLSAYFRCCATQL